MIDSPAALLTDPGLQLALRWMLAALFVIALAHKLAAPAAFERTLRDYRVLPAALLSASTWLVIAAELVAVVLLLFNRPGGSALALGLLSVYTLAIAVNLLRGRRDIDCGCAGPYLRQTLSPGLLLRNAGFLALCALSILPASTLRSTGPLDWLSAALAALLFALLYSAAARLAYVNGRFGHH